MKKGRFTNWQSSLIILLMYIRNTARMRMCHTDCESRYQRSEENFLARDKLKRQNNFRDICFPENEHLKVDLIRAYFADGDIPVIHMAISRHYVSFCTQCSVTGCLLSGLSHVLLVLTISFYRTSEITRYSNEEYLHRYASYIGNV